MPRISRPGQQAAVGSLGSLVGRQLANQALDLGTPRGRDGGRTLQQGEPYAVTGDVLSDAVKPQDGYVRLVTDVPAGESAASIDLYALSSPLMLSDGFGDGWQDEDRFQRVSATVWAGGKPLAQQVDVLLDRLYVDGDVEEEWNVLERLSRPPQGTRPPALRLVGPWLHTDLRWYLQIAPPTDPDDWVWDRGSLVRARATLTLRQLVKVDLADRATGKQAAAKVQRTVTARKGDTLKTIAKRELGNARRASELGKLNGIHDTERKLTQTTTIRLPS